jgi:hypothetical protein
VTVAEVRPMMQTRCIKTDDSGAIKTVRTELRAMHGAAQPFPTCHARDAFWSQAWELAVFRAARCVESNRKQFYSSTASG